VWDRLGAARDALTGARRVPDDSTLSRVLAGIDADALDAAVCRWLLDRPGLAGTGRRVIAVDGKTLRGSGPAGAQVHLLAALDQAEQTVLARIDVAGKTNEISRFVPLLPGWSWPVRSSRRMRCIPSVSTPAGWSRRSRQVTFRG
jgi:hypothetical protein